MSRNGTATTSRLLTISAASLLFLGAAAAIVYLVILNMLVADGYVVKRLEKQLLGLQREREQLESSLAELRTPTVLRESTVALGLIEVDGARYPKPEAAFALSNPLR